LDPALADPHGLALHQAERGGIAILGAHACHLPATQQFRCPPWTISATCLRNEPRETVGRGRGLGVLATGQKAARRAMDSSNGPGSRLKFRSLRQS
jgi:hypothetical protein